MKVCSKCHYRLPVKCFYPDCAKTSGFSSECRSCKLAGGKTQHRMSRSPTHMSWSSMLSRCRDKNSPGYGGRGITVDPRWYVFRNFLMDMGRRPAGTSIERKDVNGNYCKDNCRWATVKEQCNNKRNSRFLSLRGETKTVTQWAEHVGLSPNALRERLKRGVDPEIAVFTPKLTNCHSRILRTPLNPSIPMPLC